MDSAGNEEVFRTTSREYFAPMDHQLASTRVEDLFGTVVEKYIRDEHGLLLEIDREKDGELIEKTKYVYNDAGQRTKRETFKDAGLFESNSYSYDVPPKEKGKLIRAVHEVFGENGYKEEFEYERTEDNLVTKARKKVFYGDQLQADVTNVYSGFINGFPTQRSEEGYNSPTVLDDGTVHQGKPFKTLTVFTLNETGDVMEYQSETQDTHPVPEDIFSQVKSSISYTCRYTYDDKKEWIQLIFFANPGDKYIVIREIIRIKQ